MAAEFMPLKRPSMIAAALIALGALATPAQATSNTDIYDPTDVPQTQRPNTATAPEPASLLLLGGGLAALGATIRRRRGGRPTK